MAAVCAVKPQIACQRFVLLVTSETQYMGEAEEAPAAFPAAVRGDEENSQEEPFPQSSSERASDIRGPALWTPHGMDSIYHKSPCFRAENP